jgi:hypothetical protein
MIDVGNTAAKSYPHDSLNDALRAGRPRDILGERWQLLSNLVKPENVHPKLRSEAVRFVMSGEGFSVRDQFGKVILNGAGSHARGGMSNAWGAQLIRYTDADIEDAGGWPIDAGSLTQYYNDLEEHIGIAGQVDDLHEFFGSSKLLLPPIKIVPSADYIYKKYKRRQTNTDSKELLLGRPRLAITTESFKDNRLYEYGETEFLTTGQAGLYTAQKTLQELQAKKAIDYFGGQKLLSFKEYSEYVELNILDIETEQTKKIFARQLLIGCGTIQTARLVLKSYSDGQKSLPFIDHPPTLLPLFIPRMFGSKLPIDSFPTQLAGTLQDQGRRNIISFHYPGSLLWSDLLPDIPLPMNTALRTLKSLLGGMLVAQMWEASHPSPNNRLRLNENDQILIDYPDRHEYQGMNKLLGALCPLGVYSSKHLSSMSPPGWGFHHAGCLPMSDKPNKYETHIDGRLWDSKRVRIIDGSVLPSLPAKHHSLTLMANAARIADEALKCEY